METQIIVVNGYSKVVMDGTEVDAGKQCSNKSDVTFARDSAGNLALPYFNRLLTQSSELPV